MGKLNAITIVCCYNSILYEALLSSLIRAYQQLEQSLSLYKLYIGPIVLYIYSFECSVLYLFDSLPGVINSTSFITWNVAFYKLPDNVIEIELFRKLVVLIRVYTNRTHMTTMMINNGSMSLYSTGVTRKLVRKLVILYIQ